MGTTKTHKKKHGHLISHNNTIINEIRQARSCFSWLDKSIFQLIWIQFGKVILVKVGWARQKEQSLKGK